MSYFRKLPDCAHLFNGRDLKSSWCLRRCQSSDTCRPCKFIAFILSICLPPLYKHCLQLIGNSVNFGIWNNKEHSAFVISILAQQNHSPIIKCISMVSGNLQVSKLIQLFLSKLLAFSYRTFVIALFKQAVL